MRVILALAAIAVASVALGGCFGHHQKTYTSQVIPEPAPPPVYRPLK